MNSGDINIFSTDNGNLNANDPDSNILEDRRCQKISIIGAELGLGCGKNGPQFAPEAIRNGDIINKLKNIGLNVEDCGNIPQNKVLETNQNPKLKNLSSIIDFNERLAAQVNNVVSSGNIPMILGGDHSIALGSVSGVAKKFGENLGLIWIDAHADINTPESSPSGNIHGMPIAALLGRANQQLNNIYFCDKKIVGNKVLIIAARDIDPGELTMIKQENVHLLGMDIIKQKGIDTICQQVSQIIADWNVENIHLSIDIDSLDPKFVPGTGTPVEDGLNPEELFRLIDTITLTNKVKSVDIVELNPLLDNNEQQTVKITTDIVEFVGKKLK